MQKFLMFLQCCVVLTAVLLQSSPLLAGFVISTPAGLNAGDKFRILFVTAGTTNATSTDIGYYNTFVQTQAGGATYNGQVVNWKAIGSTATVNARDDDQVGGFESNVGVYLSTGTMIANNMGTGTGGLWSATLLAAPNQLLDGTAANRQVWTGSERDGTLSGGHLGSDFRLGVVVGNTPAADRDWLKVLFDKTLQTHRSMYGLSEELTVPDAAPIPEPATCTMFLIGIASCVVGARRRRGGRE